MFIGLMTDSLSRYQLSDVLRICGELGIRGVELATGNFSTAPHLDLTLLLRDAGARRQLRQELREHDLTLTALNCNGNLLHPHPEIGPVQDRVARQTIELASLLEVDTVVTMSGCPGDQQGGLSANWVLTTWPPDFKALLEWQWQERIIPYWQEMVAFARERGIRRIALEMHPGQAVYNPPTLLRLRDAVGPEIGANLDPSHLFWQGIDPVLTVRRLGSAIFHVHAKDTRIDQENVRHNGVLAIPLGQPVGAWPWAFRTLGLGHDTFFWRDFADALRQVGYSGPLSIEHEDVLHDPLQAVKQSVRILQDCL